MMQPLQGNKQCSQVVPLCKPAGLLYKINMWDTSSVAASGLCVAASAKLYAILAPLLYMSAYVTCLVPCCCTELPVPLYLYWDQTGCYFGIDMIIIACQDTVQRLGFLMYYVVKTHQSQLSLYVQVAQTSSSGVVIYFQISDMVFIRHGTYAV